MQGSGVRLLLEVFLFVFDTPCNSYDVVSATKEASEMSEGFRCPVSFVDTNVMLLQVHTIVFLMFAVTC
jgi:hypothetical protein